MPFSAADLAKHLQGEVLGDANIQLRSFAQVDQAQPGDLTFAENEEFFARAENSSASAVIVSGNLTSTTGKTLIRVANARVAFAKVLTLFFPEPVLPAGVHPSAVVARSAQIDAGAYIGPNCVIGERVHIAGGTILHANNYVGNDSKIGAGSVLFPNVTIYHQIQIGARVRIHAGSVIGSDGYGYVQDGGVHRKVPQIGIVIIGDDVEIGANVTIDRGALGPTTIGKGTKIDNLVQIAHNVQVGEHCLIIAQVGVAGSAKLGNYVILAGQAGVGGHLKIGNRAIIAGQSGVMRDVPDGETWLGSPAHPDKQTKRQYIALQRLPELIRRINKLERDSGAGSAAQDE